MGRCQAVVVAVHLAGQIGQGLAGVAEGPAGHQLMILDHRPRDIRRDVHGEWDGHEAECREHHGQAKLPTRPEPALRWLTRGLQQAHRVAGTGQRGQRPEADLPAQPEQPGHDERPAGQRDRHEQRGDSDGPERDRSLESADCEGAEEDQRPEGGRRADREAQLLVGPGDRVDDRRDDGDQGEHDHDQQEREVAVAGGFGDADRHVAQDAGDTDEADDRKDPAEGAPDQDQQDQRPDGVGRHPFAGEGEAE